MSDFTDIREPRASGGATVASLPDLPGRAGSGIGPAPGDEVSPFLAVGGG